MAVQSKTVLKGYFNTGDYPTEAQFAALIDSLSHRAGLFNVVDYGAVGDGNTPDTAAIQAAANDAIAHGGTLYFPPAPVWWHIGDTILLQPASGVEFTMHMLGDIQPNGIIYTGAGDKPVFRSLGWRHSKISGIHLKTSLHAGAVNNTVAFDCDTSAAFPVTSELMWENCRVNMDGTGTGHIGWRLGHSRVTDDNSQFQWIDCMVNGSTQLGTQGEIGWCIGAMDALSFTWLGCWNTNLYRAITNIPRAGGASPTGGGSFFFYGCGGGYNNVEIEYARKADTLVVSGGRYENGQQFLVVDNSAEPLLAPSVNLTGTHVAAFRATNQFLFRSSGSLTLTDVDVEAKTLIGEEWVGPDLGADLITLGVATGYTRCKVDGGVYEATDPFYTEAAGTVKTSVTGALLQNSVNHATGFATDH